VERDLWFDTQGTLLKTRFKRSGYDVTYILDRDVFCVRV